MGNRCFVCHTRLFHTAYGVDGLCPRLFVLLGGLQLRIEHQECIVGICHTCDEPAAGSLLIVECLLPGGFGTAERVERATEDVYLP